MKPDGSIVVVRNARRKKFTGQTRKEVAGKMRAYNEAVANGEPVNARAGRTVGDHLANWLDSTQLSESTNAKTVNGYRNCVRLYIDPGLGNLRLADLRAHHIIDWMDALAKAGRSPATIKKARTILGRSLKIAVQRQELSTSPVDSTDGPRVRRQVDGTAKAGRAKAMTTEQARHCLQFLDATEVAEFVRLRAAWSVAISLGLRRGELLGLTWDLVDLDADRPQIRVERTLKTIRNDRTGKYETVIDLTETSDRPAPSTCRPTSSKRSEPTANGRQPSSLPRPDGSKPH